MTFKPFYLVPTDEILNNSWMLNPPEGFSPYRRSEERHPVHEIYESAIFLSDGKDPIHIESTHQSFFVYIKCLNEDILITKNKFFLIQEKFELALDWCNIQIGHLNRGRREFTKEIIKMEYIDLWLSTPFLRKATIDEEIFFNYSLV